MIPNYFQRIINLEIFGKQSENSQFLSDKNFSNCKK